MHEPSPASRLIGRYTHTDKTGSGEHRSSAMRCLAAVMDPSAAPWSPIFNVPHGSVVQRPYDESRSVRSNRSGPNGSRDSPCSFGLASPKTAAQDQRVRTTTRASAARARDRHASEAQRISVRTARSVRRPQVSVTRSLVPSLARLLDLAGRVVLVGFEDVGPDRALGQAPQGEMS